MTKLARINRRIEYLAARGIVHPPLIFRRSLLIAAGGAA